MGEIVMGDLFNTTILGLVALIFFLIFREI